MADLVIDHCAVDSGLVSEHPEWVALDSDGAVIHPSFEQDGSTVVWADLAQLDHRGTADPDGLYQYCLAVVRHLLGLGFDGFRCDAAYGVPAEFWRRLIADIKDGGPSQCSWPRRSVVRRGKPPRQPPPVSISFAIARSGGISAATGCWSNAS